MSAASAGDGSAIAATAAAADARQVRRPVGHPAALLAPAASAGFATGPAEEQPFAMSHESAALRSAVQAMVRNCSPPDALPAELSQ